jgi:ADP-heptose:LPS heptosyltransferase/lauroyl/myristoyl acyltransferase
MKNQLFLVFVKSLGLCLSQLPYPILEKLTESLAFVFSRVPNSRWRLLLSNLSHVFPDWSFCKIKRVAFESSARMFEMGFFSLCYPFMSGEERRRTVFYNEETFNKLMELRLSGRPVLMLIPHTCLFESLATSPFFRPFGGRSLGAIYRPNKNPVLDKWITKAREKVGIKTFSRKEGIISARSHLKAGNWLALLYDQNAGVRGTGMKFMGRICAVSPLPDLLSRNKEVLCVHAIARRVSFFRTKLELKILAQKRGNISQQSHNVLESEIEGSGSGLPEWLWSHGKWKINNMIHEIFLLQEKFRSLDFGVRTEQTNHIWIRMPNWLGDAVMAIPIIRAIRHGRPDAIIHLLCKSGYVSLLESLKLADEVVALPRSKGFKYYIELLKFRSNRCDAILVLTNSLRGDIEAKLLGAESRLGMVTNKKRPLLNYQYDVPAEIKDHHQLSIWFSMLAKYSHFGPPEMKQFCKSLGGRDVKSRKILVAPGSLNTPAKRLPTEHWAKIVKLVGQKLPNMTFKIIGTSAESEICDDLYSKVKTLRCENLCGKTGLLELSQELKRSKCLLCNDSGAMHLANFLGTPIFAIFCVTSAEKTGPVFSGSPEEIFMFSQNQLDDRQTIDGNSLNESIQKFLLQLN